MKVLVTGTAGFIGSFTAARLVQRGDDVVGIDNINDYYDIQIKYGRLKLAGIDPSSAMEGIWVESGLHQNYKFIKTDLQDRESLNRLFQEQKFDMVCHLAAQAGVRYSLTNPHSYIDANIEGFLNVLPHPDGMVWEGITHKLCHY